MSGLDMPLRHRASVQDTIYTVSANCQDCYRCVRACPVKAIRVSDGQASVEDSLCIKCGTCVRECPQGAKKIRSSIENVRRLFESNVRVAVSIAPSFPAVFRGWRAPRIPSALRMLGFTYVTETAEGASQVADEALRKAGLGSVCTACPAVVNYVEMYRPHYADQLMPIVSPMVAHGRMLKERYGNDCAVVFVGPCAAKKHEASRPEHADAIDEVLTFTELLEMFTEADIDLSTCIESAFEHRAYNETAKLFPIQGGMLRTGDVACDGTQAEVIHLSGVEDVVGVFELAARDWSFRIVEPLFCAGGCINGPAMPHDLSIFERRQAVIDYSKPKASMPTYAPAEQVELAKSFHDSSMIVVGRDVSLAQIENVLESMGKIDPVSQLNCGACGYKSCYENAYAIVCGLAEPQMCMPYMRRLAQQRSDRIIETNPSGVVVLDSELNIINMNPAFQKMFMCNNSILGRRISYLVNAEGYEILRSGVEESYETIRAKYGVRYHEVVFALRDETQYVGTYTDLSRLKFDSRQIDLVRRQTLEQAKQLLDHQISFSQEMADYLGRSTAQNEEFVRRLMSLFADDDSFKGEQK